MSLPRLPQHSISAKKIFCRISQIISNYTKLGIMWAHFDQCKVTRNCLFEVSHSLYQSMLISDLRSEILDTEINLTSLPSILYLLCCRLFYCLKYLGIFSIQLSRLGKLLAARLDQKPLFPSS